MKNPDYPDTLYVSELVVPHTVNTMPEKTLRAFADHGSSDSDRIGGYAAQAQQVFTDLETVGIDLTDVFLTLENDGVTKFENSWNELQHSVRDQLANIHH